ncbi:MAG: ATP-dependent DNA helicase RecG [Dactylosporangium sp.]|nr:putative DNA binding domain-containing protein [Dactylosporangium sp.]NNJ60998.1 ATP-dependent DNA helicase RecG [Dactylosporangium sp.]
MSIQVLSVSLNDVKKALLLEEGHFLDVKRIDLAPAKLTRTIAAFANADGGEIYVGINEDKAAGRCLWRGFAKAEDANGHIQAFDQLFPLGHGFDYEFLRPPDSSDGLVLHITVQKSPDVKTASDGVVYVRRGAQNIPYKTPELLDRLRRTKGITSFETQAVAIDLDVVTNSEVIIEFLLAVVPIAEPLPWLKKQQLVVGEMPTAAALLLFADEPQAALPKRSAVKVYRYKSTEAEGARETLAFDPITIEGCLYRQIEDAVARTVETIQQIKILGSHGLESISYPQVALHEIITNAVLHRDYGIADDVHVRIFDNRVEVESPGRLPAHITPENILRERYSRNGNLVRLINKFPNPPNKDVGEGLNTAFAAMKQLKLAPPIVRQTENSVVVDIRHQRLGSPEELIMEHLADHDEITNRKVRELTGIGSENKVKSIFLRLADAGQIERVPGKRGSSAAWRKVGADSEVRE